MLIILFIVSALLPSPSVLHFTHPPSWCQVASLCNHTGIPECAKERDTSHIRMFLDYCDISEYNCDNKNDYNKIEMLHCQHNNSECTRHKNITTPMTKSTTNNTMSQTTPLTAMTNNTVTQTTIITTLNETESTTKTSLKTNSEPPTAEATTKELMTIAPTTKESTTETSLKTNSEPPTTEATTKEPMTIAPTTKESTTIVTTSIEPNTPNNCTRTVNNTAHTTQMMSTIKQNVTKEVTDSMTSVTQSTVKVATTTTVEYEEVEATKDITKKPPTTTTPRSSLVECDTYPKYCSRPSTWDTTVKGETRDFYQILRAKFGNRVKLMKATTHWPRRYIPYEIDGTFMFGRHKES